MNTIRCTNCNQPFDVKPYIARKSGNHFCSQPCYGIWQKLHPRPRKHKRVKLVCSHCGETFHRHPSAVKENKNVFCSRTCYARFRSANYSGASNPAWAGGVDGYRGANWSKQSAKARERDNHTCQRCGTDEGIIVHHVTPYRLCSTYKQANKLSNLITLCRPCHSKEEKLFNDSSPIFKGIGRKPDSSSLTICVRCGTEFIPGSPVATVCESCLTFTCEWCGKVFISRRGVSRNVRFCSKECMLNERRIPKRSCKGCGKMFQPDRRGVMFCSQECHLTFDNPRRKFFARQKNALQP